MYTWLRKLFSILLAFLLALNTISFSGAPVKSDASTPAQVAQPAQRAQAGMPDELMSAFLEATSQPFEVSSEGYHARSGGLDFTLDAGGLQASGDGFIWGLALSGFGRVGQISPVSKPQMAHADGRLDYRRGALTEWYRNTALGIEQGFTIHQAPPGVGSLILQLNPSASPTDPTISLDADGSGMSLNASNGKILRYDHLRAWDVKGAVLDARLSYAAGQMILEVNDQAAAYPITVDPLIYLEQKVTGPESHYYGYSSALSGDTALIGGSDGGSGAAYVFTRSGMTWSLQQRLPTPVGSENAWFGGSVALSGDTALVGACFDDVGGNGDQGSAYVFTRNGTTWNFQQQLIASDGAAGDYFGLSVALSADIALVGALTDGVDENTQQGSAYVFTRSGTVWTQQVQLTAPDGEAFDYFGRAVALSGDTALVGAYRHNVGAYYEQGAAYIFTLSGITWTQQAKLIASDGIFLGHFGRAVALSGDIALVGMPGAISEATYVQGPANIYTSSKATRNFQQQLPVANSAPYDHFGFSVALSSDTARLGAPNDELGANDEQGSAYIFVRTGTTWTQQAKLTALDGNTDDCFGTSVVLSGDTAVVGAFLADVVGNYNQGAAYVFTRSGPTWTQQGKLTASDGAAGDEFGWSVALFGDTALVGTNSADDGPAYFYELTFLNNLYYLPVLYRSAP